MRRKVLWMSLDGVLYTGLLKMAILTYIFQSICAFVKDINPKAYDGGTPLHLAAQIGNYEICKFIIDNTVDKNPKDFVDWTPLHWGSQEGHLKICELIIGNVQNKNPVAKNGRTPLQLAVLNSQMEVGNLIIKNL